MADTKLTELTEAESVASTDLLYVVTDPGGTPTGKKATVGAARGFPTFTVSADWYDSQAEATDWEAIWDDVSGALGIAMPSIPYAPDMYWVELVTVYLLSPSGGIGSFSLAFKYSESGTVLDLDLCCVEYLLAYDLVTHPAEGDVLMISSIVQSREQYGLG